jgi:tRNA G18 (ribose-2'-O)-methylase SpoU
MSGIFKVKVYTGEREELLDKIDMPIVVADMGGEDAFSASILSPFCLVIGNEGRGVSETLRKKANYTVKIPMQNGMESLNAAVSAGILMYALKND